MRLHVSASVFAKHDRDLRAKIAGLRNRVAKIVNFGLLQ